MNRQHQYDVIITWTGNKGDGTKSYSAYDRNHTITAKGKKLIEASSDLSFRGDASRYNPEEMLVASLSSCHMLWFLHLCADHGAVVESYDDHATGNMIQDVNSGGRFSEVHLHPQVSFRGKPPVDPEELHVKANSLCFIANSCNFPVFHHAKHTIV